MILKCFTTIFLNSFEKWDFKISQSPSAATPPMKGLWDPGRLRLQALSLIILFRASGGRHCSSLASPTSSSSRWEKGDPVFSSASYEGPQIFLRSRHKWLILEQCGLGFNPDSTNYYQCDLEQVTNISDLGFLTSKMRILGPPGWLSC